MMLSQKILINQGFNQQKIPVYKIEVHQIYTDLL